MKALLFVSAALLIGTSVVAGCEGRGRVLATHRPSGPGSEGSDGGRASTAPNADDAGTIGAMAGRPETGDGATGYASPLCSGAHFRSGEQVVAAGISGSDLVLVTANAGRRVAASFHPSVTSGLGTLASRVSTADGRVTASLGRETIRLDSEFRLLYRLPAFADVAADAGIGATSEGNPRFIRADGTVVAFEDAAGPLSVTLQGPPDAGGWMLASWTSAANFSAHGLLNVDGRIQPFFHDEAGGTYSMATLAGQYVFLHGQETFTLTFGTASGTLNVPMNVPASPGPLQTYLWIAGSARIGLVTSAYDPRLYRVDGAMRAVTLMQVPADVQSAVQSAVGGSVVVAADGATFLGIDSNAAPLWTYDANRDRLATVHLEALAPLRAMDGKYCNKPTVGIPGTEIGIGLRDDAVAGFYIVPPVGSARRIGRPFRDVMAVTGRLVGSTWVVTGNNGKNSYCPAFEPFSASQTDGTAVSGNSIQIVPPSGEPLVFTAKDEWAMGITELDLHGMCVFRQDDGDSAVGAIHDLDSRTTNELGSFRSFAWLP